MSKVALACLPALIHLLAFLPAWSARFTCHDIPPVPYFQLSCPLLQPLVREGRMDKFYFEPSRDEMASALCALFAPQLGPTDVDALLDAFPQQPMDFFGSIKARLVDGAVRGWLRRAGGAEVRSARGPWHWNFDCNATFVALGDVPQR
jgi:hypothetical protein